MTEEEPQQSTNEETVEEQPPNKETKGEKPKKPSKKERKALFRAKQEAKKEAERIKSERIRASRVMPEELKYVCRDYMLKTCEREGCRFIHDPKLCKRYFQHGNCKFGLNCRKKHFVNEEMLEEQRRNFQRSRPSHEDRRPHKFDGQHNEQSTRQTVRQSDVRNRRTPNTENFDPVTRAEDMRVVVDTGKRGDKLSKEVRSRDVVLVPNLFDDYAKGELYDKLVKEIQSIQHDNFLKMWHGNEKIEGTHLIADDKVRIRDKDGNMKSWKEQCPTFNMVIERIKSFFGMDVKATRFNWYQDESHYKPFHKDAAAVDQRKAQTQNFTVAVSFGATRKCGFERDSEGFRPLSTDGSARQDNRSARQESGSATNRTMITFPIGDGEIYCFADETNMLWRHGVIGGKGVTKECGGRISIIAWGWLYFLGKSVQKV